MRKNISRFESENSKIDVKEEITPVREEKKFSSLDDFY